MKMLLVNCALRKLEKLAMCCRALTTKCFVMAALFFVCASSSLAHDDSKLSAYFSDFYSGNYKDTESPTNWAGGLEGVSVGFIDMNEVDLSNVAYIARTYSERTGLNVNYPKNSNEATFWIGFSSSFLNDLKYDRFGIYKDLYVSDKDYEYDRDFLGKYGSSHSCYFRVINKSGKISGFLLLKSGVRRTKFYTCVHRAFMTMHGFHVNMSSKINSILSNDGLVSPSFIDMEAIDKLY